METEILYLTGSPDDEEKLLRAGEIVKKGGLAAFPTETVYGLGGNAFDPEASRKIYAAKGRPSDNPLIVHIARLEDLPRVARTIPEEAKRLARAFWPGPLTMIFEKQEEVPKETTGGLNTVAVRFPSDPYAQRFIRYAGGFVAAPSANLSGRPSTTKGSHVIRDMDGRIDVILSGDDCEIGLESTIVDLTVAPPAILRPGFYGEEAISSVLHRTVLSRKGVLSDKEAPKAPGMKYRHYAPKAELQIFEGTEENIVNSINEAVLKCEAAGRRAAVLCADETKDRYRCGTVFSLGSRKDEKTIARRLFAVLRKTDDCGIDVIFSEPFDTPLLGTAIMNRLEKAAGGKINQTQEKKK